MVEKGKPERRERGKRRGKIRGKRGGGRGKRRGKIREKRLRMPILGLKYYAVNKKNAKFDYAGNGNSGKGGAGTFAQSSRKYPVEDERDEEWTCPSKKSFLKRHPLCIGENI